MSPAAAEEDGHGAVDSDLADVNVRGGWIAGQARPAEFEGQGGLVIAERQSERTVRSGDDDRNFVEAA